MLQIVKDGRQLTAQRLLQNQELTLTKPILVDDNPKSIGMKVLSNSKRSVTVRDIADIIGHHFPVHVIDVEHQEELEGWTLADLVEYYEDEERLLIQHQQELRSVATSQTQRSRRRRKAAEKCIMQTTLQRPRVLNQISLEFSHTPLRKHILSPKFVRDLDWIDHAWPRNESDPADVYPNVQYYCLTSASGCYTDFHIDFGGTAVWYHILTGAKTFVLIPPSKENLSIYEDWLCRLNQSEIFLPDMIPNPDDVIRVSVPPSKTLIIPTGWIHAVYTPADSIVLGGNFLHGLDISLQLQVHCIETRTRVQEKFRFPFFLPLNFYAGGMYLEKLRRGTISQREVDELGELIHALEEWWKVQSGLSQMKTGQTVPNAAQYAAAKNKCSTVEEYLSELRKEHERVVANGISPTDGVLPSPEKPKLRLKLPTGDAVPAALPSPGSGKFRISVSSSAVQIKAPVPLAKPKKPREDTDWYDDDHIQGADEDYFPSLREKAKFSSETKPNKRSKSPSNSSLQVEVKRPKTATAVARRQPTKTTARQRLMKRFR